MKVTGFVIAGCLALTACGGGTADSMTPLNVSQRLSDARVPCDKPAVDHHDPETRTLADGALTVQDPAGTLVTCEAPGGPYEVFVWPTSDDAKAALRAYCLLDATRQANQEAGVRSGAATDEFVRADVGLGPNWLARASTDSIVSTPELSQALGGDVSTLTALCTPFASDVKQITDAMTNAAAKEAAAKKAADAAQQAEQSAAALEEALRDPAQALTLANTASTSPQLLGRLAQESDDYRVGCILARNSQLPSGSLRILATRDYPNLVQRYGMNNAYKRVVKYRGQVGVCLAESELTPVDVLQTLLDSPYSDARRAAKSALKKRS